LTNSKRSTKRKNNSNKNPQKRGFFYFYTLMQTFQLNDSSIRESLFPFSLNRHVADIRIGMLTIREKWEYGFKVFPSLEIPFNITANIIPSLAFFSKIEESGWESALEATETYRFLNAPWEIAVFNDWAIRSDFELMTLNMSSAIFPKLMQTIGNQLFFEDGVTANFCSINTETGPVYISKNALIMEGAHLRGPLFVGEGAVIKMGATIYGATTIGPYCVIGGEVKNSIFFGYSNKAHDGYIGDAVIGEWCNLGAGTSCSNLKNTATEVNVWSMQHNKYVKANKKCGILMGDYSRCAINTSFNTGTVIGICANIFESSELTPKFFPNFAWGNNHTYKLDKAFQDIENWMEFKNKTLSQDQKNILSEIYYNNNII